MLAPRRLFFERARCQTPPRAVSGYHDSVDPSDHNNRECFVYSLGRYGNRPIYCMGETNDLHATEFLLKRTFPIYTKVQSMPAEDAKGLKKRIKSSVEIKRLQPDAIVAPSLADSLSSTDWVFLEAPDECLFEIEEEVTKKMS